MAIAPIIGQYDYNLGIEPDIIDYILESNEIQSRISSTPCYLLVQNLSGSVVGSEIIPIPITTYYETAPRYKTIIWESGENYPDTRSHTNQGKGSIFVFIDSIEAVRVLDEEDLISDNEFTVVVRQDLVSKRVEVIFNEGFNPLLHTITYYYYTINRDICDLRMHKGDSASQSIFGWSQYLEDHADAFRSRYQILVRFPMAMNDLVVNEEGKVELEDNQCWMTSYPIVHDYDILVIPAEFSPLNREMRFEITNKQDSIIQRRLVSQRFRVNLIEMSDPRYKINIEM